MWLNMVQQLKEGGGQTKSGTEADPECIAASLPMNHESTG